MSGLFHPNTTLYILSLYALQVKFPSRETVFDYWLDPETGSFEQWTKSPYFFSIDYDSRVTPMTQVTCNGTESGRKIALETGI